MKTIEKILTVAFFVIVFGLVLFLITEKSFHGNKSFHEKIVIEDLAEVSDGSKLAMTLGERNYGFEVVNTAPGRTLGLSGREEIGCDGLLFVFEKKDLHTIWMKEMKFNLDLIWIEDEKVVDITYGLPAPAEGTRLEQLPNFSPSVPANILIEVNEGFVEKYEIKIGDQLKILETIY